MAKKASFDPTKVVEIAEGMNYVRHPLDLIMSSAWRGQSINCRRLVERLEVEHLQHAGLENGQLIATYEQLIAWGIGRRLIHSAIAEAEARGLVRARRGGRKSFVETYFTKYRLTFLKSIERGEDGKTYYAAPTNEWRNYREPDTSENAIQVHEGEPTQCMKVNLHGSPSYTVEALKPAESLAPPIVHEGEPLCISWLHGADEHPDKPTDDITDQQQSTSTTNIVAGRQQQLPGRAHDDIADQLRTDINSHLKKIGRGGGRSVSAAIGVRPANFSAFLTGKRGLPISAQQRLITLLADHGDAHQ